MRRNKRKGRRRKRKSGKNNKAMQLIKKRFEKFTTTRKGFAYMKCKGRIEGEKKMEREEEGLAM